LKTIPVGSVVYNVYAVEDPS